MAFRISPHLLDDVSLFKSYVNRILFMFALLVAAGCVRTPSIAQGRAGTPTTSKEATHV